MSVVVSLIIWLNLLSPGIASFNILSLQESLIVLCLEISIILIVHRFPAGFVKCVLAILSLLAPFNVWYILTYHSILNSEVLRYCITMPLKADSEFLLSVVDSGTFLTAILVSGVSGLLCWRKYNVPADGKTRLAMFSVGLMFFSIFAVYCNIIAPKIQRPSFMSFAMTVSAFPINICHAISKEILPELHAETEPAAVAVNVARENETDEETVIYVIGESARADHWHRNGYHRETTPFIDSENIINFAKVRSISDCTCLTVPGLLGMQGAEQLYYRKQPNANGSCCTHGVPRHASLFDYFRSAGFFTSAIINFNQSVLPIESIGTKLDHIEITDKDASQFDTQMLPNFYRELARPFKKKFIVLHIYGSHFQYVNRYPPQFDKFKDNSSQFREHMAFYDNSILATDSFLHEVIEKLKSVQGKVVLVYTSDHGEGDGKKMEIHCSVPSNHTTLVPLFFWTKGKINPDKLKVLNENKDRYISQEQIAATLLDLVGIQSEVSDYSHALTRVDASSDAYYTYGYNKKLYSCRLGGCREVH